MKTAVTILFTLTLIAAIWQADKVVLIALGVVIGALIIQYIIYLHKRFKGTPNSLKQEYKEPESDLNLETYSNAYETARNSNI